MQSIQDNGKVSAYNYLAEYYDRLMHDCDYDKWSQYLYLLLTKHGCLPPSIGMDAACGTGNITRNLWEKGYKITGFDISESMLTCAADKSSGGKPSYLQADITKFYTVEPLQFMTCCCDGINYLPHGKLGKALANVYNALNCGGVFLFDISSEYKYKTLLDNRTYSDEAEGVYCVFSSYLNKANTKLNMDVELFIENSAGTYRRFSEAHEQYVYSQGQLTEALKHAGFKTVKSYGFLTQKTPAADSERIQFVAVK